MANESPASILFDRDGYDLAIGNDDTITINQPGFLTLGSNGSVAKFIKVNNSGQLVIVGAGSAGSPTGGIITIQGAAGGTPVPISVASLPLPSGAATEATLATRLSNATFTSRINTFGQKTMANSTPVVISSDQSAITITGSTTVSGTVTSNQGTANTLANRWPVIITDGTNTQPTGDIVDRAIFHKITDGTNTATVKAASTAAVATDPALVVAISPNNTVSVSGVADTTASGTLNALNAVVAINLMGQNGVGFQLNAGTLIGTIVPEISFDGGATWIMTQFNDPNTGNKSTSIVFSSNNTNIARSIILGNGASNARVRVSAFTSGTATCNIRASQSCNSSTLFDGPVDATTQPLSANQISGWDSTTSTLRVPAVKGASTAPVAEDQALVVVLSPNQPSIPVSNAPSTSVPNIAAGYVAHNSFSKKTAVIASTYVEQKTNAQRSFKSSSASDTSNGTGARTIILTYYDQTLAGPFTETITLNGTTAVNTVNKNISYVESIIVATAGSGLVNAGIISMFISTNGAGGTMATINAGENRTFWANHYVGSTKTCYITGLSGHNTSGSSGSLLTLTSYNPTSANSAENQISDFVRVGGTISQQVRDYNQLIKVVGPARIRLYADCESVLIITTRAAFDFYDL